MLRTFAWNHNNVGLVKTPVHAHCKNYCTRMHRFFRRPPAMLVVVAFVCMHHATNANNSQHCWANNVVTCCVRLHGALGINYFTVLKVCEISVLPRYPPASACSQHIFKFLDIFSLNLSIKKVLIEGKCVFTSSARGGTRGPGSSPPHKGGGRCSLAACQGDVVMVVNPLVGFVQPNKL